MTNRPRIAAFVTLVLLLLPSFASAQAGSATAYVQRLNAQVDAIMAAPAATDAARVSRDARVAAIVEQLLDYDAFAQGTLGSEWAAHTSAEQQEFQALLTESIRQSYLRRLEQIRDYQITYLGETPLPGGGVMVHASAQSRAARREPPIAIDYAMHRVGGEWRIRDVTTDAVSLVVNRGAAMRRIITQQGWSELIDTLRDHLARPAG